MPNTTTAKKNLRKTIRRNVINKSNKTIVKNIKKKIIETVLNISKAGVNSNDVIFAIKNFIGIMHSKVRKNSFDKLRASRFERRIVARIKKICVSA